MAKKKVIETGDKLQEALEKLNKQYGMGAVLALDSRSTGNYDVISSGSIGFDYVTLGVGGFVKGKLYELMGWEGSGKSTICGHAVANCQAKGGKVAYIDGEHAVDKHYFEALGVDTSKMFNNLLVEWLFSPAIESISSNNTINGRLGSIFLNVAIKSIK